jgi:hypothetical protein
LRELACANWPKRHMMMDERGGIRLEFDLNPRL